MARAIVEYSKTILEKVSFNADLFCKELQKAIKRLLPHEINELTVWVQSFIVNKPELRNCLLQINQKNNS